VSLVASGPEGIANQDTVLAEGRRHARAVRRARQAEQDARRRRDEWVAAALQLADRNEVGEPLRPSHAQIAKAAGVTKTRVGQLKR
jgi:hypothetical protein